MIRAERLPVRMPSRLPSPYAGSRYVVPWRRRLARAIRRMVSR